MKKTILLMIMVLLLVGVVSAASKTPSLEATIMKYEPQPAQPGKYVKVYIKLENVGTGDAKNVALEINPEYPFSLDPGKTNQKTVGLLGAKNVYITDFDLKVDEKAVEGTNKLKVRYNLDEKQETWVEQDLDINIQTENAVLSVESIRTEPEEIVPGSTGAVKIRVKNLADSFLSNIKVSLDLSSSTLLFAPINSATEKNLYQLNAGASNEFDFKIIAYPNVEAGVYKIPLTITYSDNVGTSYTKTDVVGVIVNSKPDIQVSVDSTTLMTDQKTGNIVLKVVNKGFTNVKFMNLKLQETDQFEVLSTSNQEYIGNLDSDDYQTVDFNVMLKGTDNLEIPLQLEYRDYNNKLYNEDLTLKLNIYSAKTLGQANGNYSWTIIIIVVVVIAGIIIYRRRKKKKNKQ